MIYAIQEATVEHENVLKMDPSPNPYDPANDEIFDKALKKRLVNDRRLTQAKRNILRSQGGRCAICNAVLDFETEQIELDHIVPKSEGGPDVPNNIAVIHKTCHLRKTSMERKWRAYRRKREAE